MRTDSLHAIEQLTDLLINRQDLLSDRDQILEKIAEIAKKTLEADLCVAFALNPITSRYYSPQLVGDLLDSSSKKLLNDPRPAGVTQKVLTDNIVFVDDLAQQPVYQSFFTEAEGIQAFVAIALRSSRYSKPFAVLYIDYRATHRFGEEEKTALRLFAKQASLVMQNSWFLGRNRTVARIGQEINGELENVEMLFRKLWQRVSSILDVEYFLMLAVLQPQTEKLDLYMKAGNDFIVTKDDPVEGGCAWVIKMQEPLIIYHLSQQDPGLPVSLIDIPDLPAEEESLIFVPLKFRDIVVGVLSVQHPQPNAYNSEDIQLLELLANHIALAIANINLFHDLEGLNQTGQLLTQNLDSERLLPRVAEGIQAVATADVVSIYEYNQATDSFVLPPHISGHLFVPDYPKPQIIWKDATATLAIRHNKAEFAKQSTDLYKLLGGDPAVRIGSFEDREKLASSAAVPLRVGHECVGVLFVNFRTAQRFNASQKRLIENLANYAAIAIKNARTFNSLNQRHTEELELLQQIELEISKTLDLDAILQALLQLMAAHLKADEASILLYDRHSRQLHTQAAIGAHATISKSQQIDIDSDTSIARLAFVERRPVLITDYELEPEWQAIRLVVDPATRAELNVPLLSEEGRGIGVMNFESRSPQTFSKEDEAFLRTVATHAVLAIQNAQTHTREKSLIDISREIVGQLELEKTFDGILAKALELTRSSFGVLMLYDEQHQEFDPVAERGVQEDKSESPLPLGEGIISWLVKEWHQRGRTSVRVSNVKEDPWQTHYVDYIPDIHSNLSTLLIENGSLRGVIGIESPEINAFSARDEALLTTFAQLAVVALQNADLYTKTLEGEDRLRVLHEIDQTIIEQLANPDQVMRAIVSSALRLTGAEVGELHLLYHERFDNTYIASLDETGTIQPAKLVVADESRQLARGIVAHVATTKQSYWTTGDAQQDEHFTPGLLAHSRSNIAVPMSTADQLIGVLNLESSELEFFNDNDQEILELLAGQAVIAIQNARLYQHATKRQASLRTLHQIDRSIISQLENPDVVIQLIIQSAWELVGADFVELYLFARGEVATLRTLYVARRNDEGQLEQAEKFNEPAFDWQTRGVVVHVTERKEAYYTQVPASQDTYYNTGAPIAGQVDIESEAAVPLLSTSEGLIGVLNLESKQSYTYNDDDLEILGLLAGQAVIAIKTAETYASAERRQKRFELLLEASQALAAVTDLEKIELAYDQVIDFAQQHRPCRAVIRRYEPATQELVVVPQHAVDEASPVPRLRLDQGIIGRVFREQQSRRIKDTQFSPNADLQGIHPTTRSLLIAPIFFEKDVYGTLTLSSTEVDYFYGTELALIEGLARQLALTIHRLEVAERAAIAERMGEIGESAYELTHRLGNDLGLVRSYTNNIRMLLAKNNLEVDSELEAELGKINRDVHKVLTLSRDLKQELTDEQEGHPDVVRKSRILLQDLIEAARSRLPTIPAHIHLEINPVESNVAVDAVVVHVGYILHILVSNAIEAMPNGGIIKLNAQFDERSVIIEVCDNGPGIAEALQTKIFTLFYSTKQSSGFGLWKARRRALRLNGELKVKSQPGYGATFQLLLPRAIESS